MKMKKIVPLALALTVATTAAAGAVNSRTDCTSAACPTDTFCSHSSVSSQAQQQIIEKLCEKFGFSFCGRTDCPTGTPDQVPDNTPDSSPDDRPVETPDETPDVTPDQVPDNTPDSSPDDKPVETPTVKPEETPDQDNNVSQSSFATEVTRLVNAERAKNGLGAVTVNAKVQQAAQVRAGEQAQSFSHTRPNGASCFTALTEAGATYRGAGENIAYGQSTPAAVMNAWMNSEGHRANILNASFTNIGVGYTVINGTPYWAQMFTY